MKKQVKLYLLLLFILSCAFLFIPLVHAGTYNLYTGRVTTSINVRGGPGTGYAVVGSMGDGYTFNYRDSDIVTATNSGCTSNKWIYNYVQNGYVCSSFVSVINTLTANDYSDTKFAKMTTEEFEAYLTSQGFPESYKIKLRELHAKYPSWEFKAVKSKYTWNEIIAEESYLGRSLFQVTSSTLGYQGYLSTASGAYNWTTDTFTVYDSSNWYQANNETIAYYLDPRNSLTVNRIFTFEDLLYNREKHTSDLVENILYSNFMKPLVPYFMTAANNYNVSPVYLAALSRQEVGLNGDVLQVTGTSACGSYQTLGYYNFYNIGANSSSNPACEGLKYAKSAGWNTKEKAIVGGAGWIENGYINAGQYTRYFQKWNTSPTTPNGVWHQYMTDITSPMKTAATTMGTYNDEGLLNFPYTFTIPIYDGIPASTSLPNTGNPNNWLRELKVDGISVSNFSGSTISYNLSTNLKASVTISATPITTKATISGTGTISLTPGINTIPIKVTAENGDVKTYTITITNSTEGFIEPSITELITKSAYKTDGTYFWGLTFGSNASTIVSKLQAQNPYASINVSRTSGTVGTGDKITIVSNKETPKTFEIVIYGDSSGDGKIDGADSLAIKKHILKMTTLTGAKAKAADINRDGKIDGADSLAVKKQILTIANISQN